MTNNIELKLKRRKVTIDLDEVKSMEGQSDYTLNDICKVFDSTTYENTVMKNKKIATDIKSSILTTLDQFFESYKVYKNPANKRQDLYSFGALRNSDGKPAERLENKGGRPSSDFTNHLEALILLSLKCQLLPEKDLTASKWALHFKLASEKQVSLYRTMKYSEDREDIQKVINSVRQMTDDEIEIIDDNGKKVKTRLTDKEIEIKINEVLYSYDTVISRMCGVLDKLDKAKLIEYHNDYTYGVTAKREAKISEGELAVYEAMKQDFMKYMTPEQIEQMQKDEENKHKSEFILLDPVAVSDLANKKVAVKKEIEEMKAKGERVHKFTTNKLLSQKLKNDGLTNVKGEKNYYKYTFKTASINRYFTDKELERYLNKNAKVKEVYEKGIKEVIEKSNDLKLEYLVDWFEKTYLKNMKKYEEKILNQNFRYLSTDESYIESKKSLELDQVNQKQSEYKDFGIRLSESMSERLFAIDFDDDRI